MTRELHNRTFLELLKITEGRLVITSGQLSTIINRGYSTLGADRQKGIGIPYLQNAAGEKIMYTLRDIACKLTEITCTPEQLTMMHTHDMQVVFPGQIHLSKSQLSWVRNVSQSTINRELTQEKLRKKGKKNIPSIGVSYYEQNGRIFFPISSVAEYLANTIRTA